MSLPLDRIGKIEKACGEPLRPTIAQPYLRVTEKTTGRAKTKKTERTGTLYATNSYAALAISVNVTEDETTGPVPLEAIRYARSLKEKGVKVRLTEGRAIVESATGIERASFPRGTITGDYPADVLDETLNGTKPVFTIGLNPRLLLQLAEAMGVTANEFVRLDFTDPMKPVGVTRGSDPDSTAILMPVRIR